MKILRYYCFGSNYAPFSEKVVEIELRELGFIKSSALSANIVITRNRKMATKAALALPTKTIMVWTNEPSYDNGSNFIEQILPWKRAYIFNVFTGKVFWHNYHFLSSYHFMDCNDLGMPIGEEIETSKLCLEQDFFDRKLAVGIFTCKKIPISGAIVGRKNVDLNATRQGIALKGHQLGYCDIVGEGWATEVALDDPASGMSEETPWWVSKIQLMTKYRFNLAFENTLWPYYVTEKIWQSIKAGTLPVYWGKESSIYETFPEGSFVDASSFSNSEELWSYLHNMNYDEWRRRLEVCSEVYNSSLKKIEARKNSILFEFTEKIRRHLGTD